MAEPKGQGIIYTREYGSWVMCSVSFIAGTVKAGQISGLTAVVFFSIGLLLMAKAPAERLLRRPDSLAWRSLFIFAVPALAGVVYSVFRQQSLVYLYLCGVGVLVLYVLIRGKGYLVAEEAAGMAVMGLVAAIAASLGGEVASHLYLWPLFFAFYFSSSLRVRVVKPLYRVLGGVYSGALLLSGVVLAFVGNYMMLAFLPLLEDLYAALRGRKEPFKRLGIIESIKAVVFAVLVIIFTP
jgi:hypothetical protein